MGRPLSIVVALLSLAVFAPSASALDTPAEAPSANAPNPLLGQTWWGGQRQWLPQWRSVWALRKRGEHRKADLVQKIAEQPQFKWYGSFAGYADPYAKVRLALTALDESSPGQVPLMVSMRHEGSKCSPSYQGGGPRADKVFRSWVRGFARAIGDHRAVIIVEPDALGTLECQARSRRKARLRLLAYAVDVYSKLPNATVYMDAGAPTGDDEALMARKLKAVGVHKVRGFSVNATHQATTANSITYAERMSRRLGGKHFIVNTSHNGNGPIRTKVWINRARNRWRIHTEWCNPPNAAVGARPTTNTGHPLVDAFMWIERPGYSNGACNGGPAQIGAWWLERAILMARRARW